MRLTHSTLAPALVAAGAALFVVFLLTAWGHQPSNEPRDLQQPMPHEVAESPIAREPTPCPEVLPQDGIRAGSFRSAWLSRC